MNTTTLSNPNNPVAAPGFVRRGLVAALPQQASLRRFSLRHPLILILPMLPRPGSFSALSASASTSFGGRGWRPEPRADGVLRVGRVCRQCCRDQPGRHDRQHSHLVTARRCRGWRHHGRRYRLADFLRPHGAASDHHPDLYIHPLSCGPLRFLFEPPSDRPWLAVTTGCPTFPVS